MDDNAERSELRWAAFLSHASEDAELTRAVHDALESRGLDCWIAPDDVEPGLPYADGCVLGIERSDAFVLVATSGSLRSEAVLSEIEQAFKRGKRIYSLMVDKPRLNREADFYLSRLHWLELSRASLPEVVSRLARVLEKRDEWEDVAGAPGLARTLRYRRDALMGSALGTLIVLLVAGGIAAYVGHRRTLAEDVDPDRIGLVTIVASPDAGDGLVARVATYLDERTRYADARLFAAIDADATVSRRDLSPAWVRQQVGGAQVLELALPASAKRLAMCLTAPHPRLRTPFRVTWRFAVERRAATILTALLQPPDVRPDRGEPCADDWR